MIWTHAEEHLKSFIGFLNSIYPIIKFTHEYSNSLHQTLPFLNLQVHLINNHIETDLHTKPTDKHQHFLKTPCSATQTTPQKPSHSASSSEYAAYVLPTLSLTNEAENQSSTLPSVVKAPPHYKEMRIAFAHISSYATLQPQEQKSTKTDLTLFVTSFNPALPKISSVVNKYTTLLQSRINWIEHFLWTFFYIQG